VESRDPTADIDVISFCFGIPPEQYLVEDIDRSLIRRSMWGLLPEAILCNRRRGLQSADWYKKLDRRRHQFEAELAQLSESRLAQRCLDLPRLERAIRSWPSGAWHRSDIEEEYHYAFARGVAAARFLNWIEVANQ